MTIKPNNIAIIYTGSGRLSL